MKTDGRILYRGLPVAIGQRPVAQIGAQPVPQSKTTTTTAILQQAIANMILCQTKDRVFVEYALRDVRKPR